MGHMSATGFWMVSSLYEILKYGVLYNWFAVADARNICASGWHVPTSAEGQTLRAFLDPSGNDSINVAGSKLKEVGTTYWASSNEDATNESGFNARAASYRNIDGTWPVSFLPGVNLEFWRSNSLDANNAFYFYLSSSNGSFRADGIVRNKKRGISVRLIKDSTALSDGETGTYTGNDGKIYRTICVGTQEWIADNLSETKYQNGDSIPEVADNSEWAALTTGAMCAYNNDWDNV